LNPVVVRCEFNAETAAETCNTEAREDMEKLSLDGLHPVAAERIKPFFEEILGSFEEKIHSIHVTGTALTDDFDEKVSDVRSIVVLKQMDLKFLELLAPLGKKYGKKKVSAPLIMTPDYISSSLDVFPIEFLNFRILHKTVFGKDILQEIVIDLGDLRHQAERELKSRLIWLRQGYISSMGDPGLLTEGFISSISDYIPLFRGIIRLFEADPPSGHTDVLSKLSDVTGVNTDVFTRLLRAKHEKTRFSAAELETIFEEFYHATERLGKIVDDIENQTDNR
jgi:hypothetical protein